MFCVLKFYFSFDNNSKYFWENKIQVFLFIKLASKTREMEEFTCLFPFLATPIESFHLTRFSSNSLNWISRKNSSNEWIHFFVLFCIWFFSFDEFFIKFIGKKNSSNERNHHFPRFFKQTKNREHFHFQIMAIIPHPLHTHRYPSPAPLPATFQSSA